MENILPAPRALTKCIGTIAL